MVTQPMGFTGRKETGFAVSFQLAGAASSGPDPARSTRCRVSTEKKTVRQGPAGGISPRTVHAAAGWKLPARGIANPAKGRWPGDSKVALDQGRTVDPCSGGRLHSAEDGTKRGRRPGRTRAAERNATPAQTPKRRPGLTVTAWAGCRQSGFSEFAVSMDPRPNPGSGCETWTKTACGDRPAQRLFGALGVFMSGPANPPVQSAAGSRRQAVSGPVAIARPGRRNCARIPGPACGNGGGHQAATLGARGATQSTGLHQEAVCGRKPALAPGLLQMADEPEFAGALGGRPFTPLSPCAGSPGVMPARFSAHAASVAPPGPGARPLRTSSLVTHRGGFPSSRDPLEAGRAANGGGGSTHFGGVGLVELSGTPGGEASASASLRPVGAGRMMIFADSDRNRDPPPIRRYFLTRSRNSSACCRRYWRSCHSEQNRPPLSRTSSGSG